VFDRSDRIKAKRHRIPNQSEDAHVRSEDHCKTEWTVSSRGGGETG
jgi:hypothetical protein